jgi:SAM-dependent methyltransferase
MNKNKFHDVFGLKELEIGKSYADWIYSVFAPFMGKRVLEVGSGLGIIAERMLDKELIIESDINNKFLSLLKEKFRNNKNTKTLYLDITDVSTSILNSLRTQKIDTVITLNTLEHIEDDKKAISNISKILPKNGKLLIFVPALPFIYGTFDEVLGHFRRYTKNELENKLQIAGFRIIKINYFNLIGIFWWFLTGKVFRIKEMPKNTGRILNIIVPYLKKQESLINIPIGQSLIAIAEKI